MTDPAQAGDGSGRETVIGLPVRLFISLTNLMNSVGTLWVFGMMLIICADIFARNVLNHPLNGVPEIIAFSISGTIYLQLANTLHAGKFIRAELLIEWLEIKRPFAGRVFNAIFNLFGIVVFLIMAQGFWGEFSDAWAEDEIAGVPGVVTFIVWPFYLILLVGGIATSIEFLLRFIREVSGAGRTFRKGLAGVEGVKGGYGWLLGLAGFAIIIYWLTSADLSNAQIGILSIIFMLILIYAGMPIGIALIVLGFCGIWLMKGNTVIAERMLPQAGAEYMKNYFFGVVPLFVLMGLLVAATDVGKDTFQVARWALRRVRGGLGIATVAANAVFAAITGSSIASAAAFTRVATPEMMAQGYTARFSVGVVAGSSVLGMLIPPSLLFIVYAFIAEQSVGVLFIAALIPGLILAVAFALVILGMATWKPEWVGDVKVMQDQTNGDESSRSALLKLFPIFSLMVLVIGGIYGGIFTPTEAGAAGAFGALLIGLIRRKLDWKTLWGVLVETGHITVSILFLILAANIYSRMLALSGLPQQMGGFVGDSYTLFIIAYVLILILLGMILDSISIMLIILPLALPSLAMFGGDPIWFGVVTVIAVEIGLLTPPLGITCYVVKSTLNDDRITLNQIFLGAMPFAFVMLLVTILLIAIPDLSLVFT
ncbi:MAG: C4-dicarboxylate TRAP transporter large permease protein DctM [Alphaproteobacteria bacterium MarineAlpha11_Bin1]|nr:MAG: C4-dicarboxylate TRAP transporter large permease protein DctM [Alphaproteobacteria bacterium MarineAlpha11_Bin1]